MNPSSSEPDSQPTQSSLIRNLALGGGPAWERMIRLYQPRLEASCRVRGVDDHSVQDVIQETWISVSKSLPKFQSIPGNGAFRAWLFQILRRRIADHRRKAIKEIASVGGSTMLGRLNSVPESGSSPSNSKFENSGAHPSTGIGTWSKSRPVQVAMAKIESRFESRTWMAFQGCVIDGKPTDQVAQELATSPANVRQARSRVLRMLKKELESKNPE